MQRALGWYRGLGAGGKILVFILGLLAAFVVSFTISEVILSWLSAGNDESGQVLQQDQDEALPPVPEEEDIGLEIARAEWSGNRIEVEGEWIGDLSSVHCDLFEGPDLALVDWWDRAIPPTISDRTFTQEFVEAGEREVGRSIDPAAGYVTVCRAAYPGGVFTAAEKQVEGSPSG